MEASCTYLASGQWINDVVVLGSLLLAAIGCGILGTLRDGRLTAELRNHGSVPTPEVSPANA
jgi:hypothetical protein